MGEEAPDHRSIGIVFAQATLARGAGDSAARAVASRVQPPGQLLAQLVDIRKKDRFLIFFEKAAVLVGSLRQHHGAAASRDLEGAAVVLVPGAHGRIAILLFPRDPVQRYLRTGID